MTYLQKAQSESWKLVIRGSVAVSSRRALIVSPAALSRSFAPGRKIRSVVVADHLGALELRLRYPLHLCVIAHPRFAVNVRESRLRRPSRSCAYCFLHELRAVL